MKSTRVAIAKVYDLTEKIKAKEVEKSFQEQMEQLQKAILIPELSSIWPDWERAFDEAIENEKHVGTEKALEILKKRCPINLESKE